MTTFLEVEYTAETDEGQMPRRVLVRIDAIESILQRPDGGTSLVFSQESFLNITEDFGALRTFLAHNTPLIDVILKETINAQPDSEPTSLAQRLPPQGIGD